MANQMIALGVRGPQLPDVGGIAMRYGNIMANMAAAREKQGQAQRANAFRALISSPDFDPADPQDLKAAAALDPKGAEEIARTFDTRRAAQQTYNVNEVKRLRDLGAAVGDEEGYQIWLSEVEKASPAEARMFRQFSPNFDPDKMNRIIMTADQFISKSIPTPRTDVEQDESGAFYEVQTGGIGKRGAFPVEVYGREPARGTVDVEPSQSVDQAPASAADAERFILSFPPEAREAIRARINEGALGNIPAGSPVAMSGGEGVGGPDEGLMPTGRQLRGKPPMQSPLPGSAQVPISRVRAEAQAERETPAEAAARARAVKDVELAAEQAKKQPAKKQVSTVLSKMRNAYEQLDRAEAIPSEKRGAFANALDYLATSSLGREAQRVIGTEQSKYLSQIVNLRKQLATAIKNATGMSAQEMNSNVELQLMLDTLTDPTQGIEAARQTLADLEELYGAPKAAAPRRTLTKRSDIDALLQKYGD